MEIKKIIVSRTDKIGDLVLSIPSFYMLRKMYPNSDITVLVRKYNYEIVKNLPCINRVIKIDDYRQKDLIEKIKHFNADVFIALYNDGFVSKLAKASKAKWKIGPISKLNSIFTYNKGIRQKRSLSVKNEAEYNLDLIKKLDPELFEKKYEINNTIFLENRHEKAAEVFMMENNIDGPVLIINPFMGGSAKNISDEEYVDLLKEIKEKISLINIIITCHISEEDRGEEIVKKIGKNGIFLFANGGDLLNLAAIISKADLYLGGSTGPTHIAASMKRSIVAIYPNKKTQHPVRWGVFGWKDVEYIIPDENNPKEDYSNKHFDSYNSEIKNKIVNTVIKKLVEKEAKI
ncbi:glycosyltransferase family 9 protein [uncultured Ilyobacter sp.]|uniref:glycosyltransferase family 9 protein n=1 Tax=uncultured Ilyobacter sp. TaxID=544433 RepID=UPI0029C981F4|nr:glycosyltransferase family 9 protein [uncultured Ilyobacter sp.]